MEKNRELEKKVEKSRELEKVEKNRELEKISKNILPITFLYTSNILPVYFGETKHFQFFLPLPKDIKAGRVGSFSSLHTYRTDTPPQQTPFHLCNKSLQTKQTSFRGSPLLPNSWTAMMSNLKYTHEGSDVDHLNSIESRKREYEISYGS